LKKGGALVIVGLLGNKINIPLLPSVLNEYTIFGSLWGNYNELREAIELAKDRKIRHNLNKFSLQNVNDAISLLNEGKMVGRGVIIPN
jgi:propanol-preferring alcohol dehydrogenase